jgi:hypothetical protein
MRGMVGFRFCAEVMSAGRRWGCSSKGRGQCPQQMVSAIDAQGAVELMGKFDGFSGIAAVAGQVGSAMDCVPRATV